MVERIRHAFYWYGKLYLWEITKVGQHIYQLWSFNNILAPQLGVRLLSVGLETCHRCVVTPHGVEAEAS